MSEEKDFQQAYIDIQDLITELCNVKEYNPLMVAGILMASARGMYKSLLSTKDFNSLMISINEETSPFDEDVTIH